MAGCKTRLKESFEAFFGPMGSHQVAGSALTVDEFILNIMTARSRVAPALGPRVAWHLIVRMRMFGSRLAFNLRTSSSAVANQLQVWAIPSWPGRAAKLLKKRGIPNLYFRRSDCEIIKVHLDVVARCFSS